MSHAAIATLHKTSNPRVRLGKSRLEGHMRVTTGDGHALSLNAPLRLRQRTTTFRAPVWGLMTRPG